MMRTPRLGLPVVILLAGASLITAIPGPGRTGGPAEMEEGAAPDDPYRILEDETVLAVVVQTTGIASRFAPDHLIHAAEYELTLEFDPGRPEETRFSGQFRVADLVVDEPTMKAQLGPRLVELGILDDPYDEMSEEDRESVRASMLDENQLDARSHPLMEVEAVEIGRSDEDLFPWSITGSLTVRGERVEVPLRGRLEQDGARIRIEAYGPSRFADLGIAPYRAFLGAVRNRDEFHFYVLLVAEASREG